MTYLPTPLSHRMDVCGLNIELETLGEGKPLVYLHAGDGADRDAPFLQPLSRFFSVYLPSHPGFGGSDLPGTYDAIDDLAYFYLDFLERRDLDEVVLVGSSFGGWLAAEIAIRNTSRISHLVLAAPLGIKIDGREERGITDIFSLNQAELSDYLLATPATTGVDYRSLPEDTVRRIVRNREAMARFGWSPTLYNPRLLRWLHRIDAPALILWGDRDRIVSTDYGAAYAGEIANGNLSILEGAGHYLPYDRPREFADAVIEFAASDGGPK